MNTSRVDYLHSVTSASLRAAPSPKSSIVPDPSDRLVTLLQVTMATSPASRLSDKHAAKGIGAQPGGQIILR